MTKSEHVQTNVAADQEPTVREILETVGSAGMRRRWLILLSATVVSLCTIYVSFRLPNRYTSEATMLTVRQQVSERYVTPAVTSGASQVVEEMKQEVLSRSELLGIINELDLYPARRETLDADELVKLIRGDISVEPLQSRSGRPEVGAFLVSFVADTPKKAQAVTQRLTDLFIRQNAQLRSNQASITTRFLRQQLETAQRELYTHEERLRDFKLQYLGELPEQQQSTLAILAGLQNQLENVMNSRNHANQQRLYLESLLNAYQGRTGQEPATGTTRSGAERAAEQELARLQEERAQLLLKYSERHPDVLSKDEEIQRQRRAIRNLANHRGADLAETTSRHSNPVKDMEPEILIAQLKSQLQANALELANLTEKEQKLQSEIQSSQSRLNQTPVREQQLASLQRDYDLLKAHYGELLKKEQESELAADLEKRQEGQQFRLAEPPSLPVRASSPKRMKITLLGMLGGFAVGCLLAFSAEMRNSTFRTTDDVKRQIDSMLVIGIPVMLTKAERTRRSCIRILECLALAVIVVVLGSGQFYVFRHG